jgi:hypothetical protein
MSLLNKVLGSTVAKTVFLQGMWESNIDITYRGCRIIYEGREYEKKDKAQNPIIQSHVPSLIAESGPDELVAFCRILFEGTVISRHLSLEFNHVGFLYLSGRR